MVGTVGTTAAMELAFYSSLVVLGASIDHSILWCGYHHRSWLIVICIVSYLHGKIQTFKRKRKKGNKLSLRVKYKINKEVLNNKTHIS